MSLLGSRYRRITVTRQIDEEAMLFHTEKIDRLRTPRRLTDVRQPSSARKSINRAGFAGVRAAGKRDLRPFIGREERGIMYRHRVCRALKRRHECLFWFANWHG